MADSIADPVRLTRRDVAAMRLALEWARTIPGRGGGAHIAIDEATRMLWQGRDVSREIAILFGRARATATAALVGSRAQLGVTLYEQQCKLVRRLLRARLALLIRALLRADAGDFGPIVACRYCQGLGCATQDANCIESRGRCPHRAQDGTSWMMPARRVSPLWEQAT